MGPPTTTKPVDIVALLRYSDLSAHNRRCVYNALVNSMIEGWMPSRESVSVVIDVAAGRIGHGEYAEQVLRRRAGR